jgi:YD repeat-containing protein
LNAGATDANGDALTYSWDFDGNGTSDATGATANTTFTTGGNKTVKLTVSDGKGGTATKDIPVQVLAADDANAKLRALVFTKTAGFRHDSIEAGTAAVRTLGTQKNWQVDDTADASLFTDAVLSHYDVVIFMSTTGDTLNDTQQAAFERFIRSGKGYVGIHAAADGEYDWRWYGNLIGAYFRNHPAGTPTGTVVVEDTTDPSTAGLPARWSRVDEWYNYKAPTNASPDDYSARSTAGVHVLLKMDESTYVEEDGTDGVDDDHPISWCQRYDGGRSWYTGLGHTQASFSEPGILSHIGAGIEIAAGVLPSAACGVAPAVNRAPVVSSATALPGSGVAPLAVAFASSATDPDGDTLTYTWDLDGNGSFETTGQNPSFTYTTPGTYVAVVKASDPAGLSATKTVTVTVSPPANNGTDVPVTVGGNVPGVLALTFGPVPSIGTFLPGVDRDYTAAVAATVTSSATAAALTVRDPSATATGHLVNGSAVMPQALQVRAGTGAFAPLSSTGAALPLTAFSAPVGARPVSVEFKQPVAATDSLLTGAYGKTLVFTLSATTP